MLVSPELLSYSTKDRSAPIRGIAKRLSLLLVLATVACSTKVDLTYAPSVHPAMTLQPVISAVTVTDRRDEEFPAIIGVLRDQYGNPHQTIVSRLSLSDEIAGTFEEALRQRNLLGSSGPDRLLVSIVRLESSEGSHTQAIVAFTYRLVDAAGTELYVGTSDIDQPGNLTRPEDFAGYLGRYAYPGVLGYPGLIASTNDLHRRLNQAVTDAVDQALDNPDFVAATRRPARIAATR